MKDNSLGWIDDLDRRLLSCREEIEDALFKRDMGLPVDIEDIKQGYKRQNEILANPELFEKVIKCTTEVPKIKRKLEIIKRKIIEAKTSESSDLQSWQNYLQQEMVGFFSGKKLTISQRIRIIKESADRNKRSEYYQLMGIFLDGQENNFKRMITLSNKLAREENFPNFQTAKFFTEETDLRYIKNVLEKVEQKTDKAWKEILKNIKKKIGVGDLELFDLYYGINQLGNQANFLPATDFFSSLKSTVKTLGIDFAKLPIRITRVVNTPPAGVYALGLPKRGFEREITVAIDPKAGWNSYAFLFHEFGHAIYYVFSPSSFLLTDSHLSREIMAEMWVGFIEQPEWLILNRFVREEKQAKEIIAAKAIWDIFQLRTQLLEAEFEINIYSDPESDFKKVWRKLSSDILGIDDHLGVYSEFVFIHPFDIKDYILAWEAKRMFVNFIYKKYGEVFNPQIVDFLVSKFYSPGAIIPWSQKLSFLNIKRGF